MPSYLDAARCVYRWPSPGARTWTMAFLERVRREQDVLAVVATGSAVRKCVPSDDLDILVLCKATRALGPRAPLDVDLRAFDIRDVDDKIAAGHDLLGWAVVFGKPMLDRRGTWHRIVKRWKGRVPLPNSEKARDRAAVARERLQEMREMGDEEAAVELEVAYLSHVARAVLSDAGVFPASRPELPGQLSDIGAHGLAKRIGHALVVRGRLRKQMVG